MVQISPRTFSVDLRIENVSLLEKQELQLLTPTSNRISENIQAINQGNEENSQQSELQLLPGKLLVTATHNNYVQRNTWQLSIVAITTEAVTMANK